MLTMPPPSIRCDTLRSDFSYDVSKRVPIRIELIDRKRPRKRVSRVVQRHFFADIGGADKNSPGRIPAQRKMIQLVRGLPGPLPIRPSSKLLVIGGFPEFMISVPSLCHWA